MSRRISSFLLSSQKSPRVSKYYTYLLISRTDVIYVGSTNQLSRRISQHKLKLIPGFTAKYNVNKLVYYEIYNDPMLAAKREKQLKGWTRNKKLWLIKSRNPEMKELLQ